MGPAHLDKDQTPLRVKTQQLLEKAGFEVVYPEASAGHCCGQPFASKGFTLPKLNQHALRNLVEQVDSCNAGFSTSRTCEVGLSTKKLNL